MFGRSMVAMVSPMKADGSLDFEALERLLEWHIEQGTDAIVATGTTGEAPTLESREHIEFLAETVRLADGRIPIIAGTGSNSTAQSLALTRHAAELGVDAVLLVVPCYNKPTQEGLYRHFRSIAEAVPIPQILYNVPGRTVADLLPETVQRLTRLSNIVGLKEATGSMERLAELQSRCPDTFEFYSGDDATAMEFMLRGGHGVISVTANIAPALMHQMCVAAIAGERVEAEALNARLMPLHNDLFVESNPIPAKWALHRMGMIENGIRLPLTPLSDAAQPKVLDALRASGVIE